MKLNPLLLRQIRTNYNIDSVYTYLLSQVHSVLLVKLTYRGKKKQTKKEDHIDYKAPLPLNFHGNIQTGGNITSV